LACLAGRGKFAEGSNEKVKWNCWCAKDRVFIFVTSHAAMLRQCFCVFHVIIFCENADFCHSSLATRDEQLFVIGPDRW
jgi:hypothetical protein